MLMRINEGIMPPPKYMGISRYATRSFRPASLLLTSGYAAVTEVRIIRMVVVAT